MNASTDRRRTSDPGSESLPRNVAGAVLMGVLFTVVVGTGSVRATGGDAQFFDSDFDAFEAASAVEAAGGNPYVTANIDAELSKGAPRYSRDFERFPGAQTRSFFNPPMWLTMLTVIGFSSSTLVLGGAFGTGAALSLLHDEASFPFPLVILPAVFLMWDRLILWANDELGQTGYLIAFAMIGGQAMLRSSKRHTGQAAGALGALLSVKPHIWLANLAGRGRQHPAASFWQFGASAVIGLVSIVHLGLTPWRQFVQALGSSAEKLPVDQSLTFTALGPPFRVGAVVIATAIATLIAVIVVHRTRWLTSESRWTLTVALTMLASTHAFWHDWAWLLVIPLLHRWDLVRALGFYLTVPLSIELSNAAPVWVVLLWLGFIVAEDRRTHSATHGHDGRRAAKDPLVPESVPRTVPVGGTH